MAEQLGFVVEAHFARYPDLGNVAFYGNPFARADLPFPDGVLPDGGVSLSWLDESSSVYDHPLVLIFANIDQLSAAALRAIVIDGPYAD